MIGIARMGYRDKIVSVMKMKSCLLTIFLAALAAPPAFSGEEAAAPLAAVKKGVVEVRVYRAQTPPPEGTAELTVELDVSRGWHINSHQPLDEFLIPTTVDLAENPHWEIGSVSYPPGKQVGLSFSDGPVSVYEGTVEMPVILRATGEPTPRTPIKLLVTFQPCNANSCIVPETVELSFSVGAPQDK